MGYDDQYALTQLSERLQRISSRRNEYGNVEERISDVCRKFRVTTLRLWVKSEAKKLPNHKFTIGIRKWTKDETIKAVNELLRP